MTNKAWKSARAMAAPGTTLLSWSDGVTDGIATDMIRVFERWGAGEHVPPALRRLALEEAGRAAHVAAERAKFDSMPEPRDVPGARVHVR